MAIKRFYVLFVFLFALVLVGCADDSAVEVTPEPAPQEEVIETPEEPVVEEEIVEPVIVEEVVVEEQPMPEQASAISSEEQANLERRVYFAFDKYNLSSEAESILRSKIAILEAQPGLRIQVQGYCDDRGTQEYNLALGERRALAAYNFLVQNGIDPNRIETISYGKLFPAVEGNTPQAWSLNRRLQFELIRK